MATVVTTDTGLPIVVIGATGQQGGAVVDALLSKGAPVRAAVRDQHGEKARALAERGVEIVPADLNSVESVRMVFTGASTGYAMTTFTGPEGIEGEVAHGRVIAQAATDTNLPFLVYSSVGGAERGSGVPHFESKYLVEKYLCDAVPVAFVRPTFFMENLPSMVQRHDRGAQLSVPLPRDIALQMVSVRAIGEVAAAFLLSPPESGSAVEIAGDELTGEQMAERFADHLGVATDYVELPLTALGDNDDLAAMYRWLTQLPSYQADFMRTRTLAPNVEDLAQWLQRRDGI
jgi:uncharacterized protein YbjT (DUF2867 family)